jgi:hypothetical protein
MSRTPTASTRVVFVISLGFSGQSDEGRGADLLAASHHEYGPGSERWPCHLGLIAIKESFVVAGHEITAGIR